MFLVTVPISSTSFPYPLWSYSLLPGCVFRPAASMHSTEACWQASVAKALLVVLSEVLVELVVALQEV